MAKPLSELMKKVSPEVKSKASIKVVSMKQEMEPLDQELEYDNIFEAIESDQVKHQTLEDLSNKLTKLRGKWELYELETLQAAIILFNGDVEAVNKWINTKLPVLDNQTPIDIIRTETGARRVLDIIGALEHGVFI